LRLKCYNRNITFLERHMKQLTPVKFALTFAGCFLGAGYVSGQELWQFFGVFGRGGLLGLALAMAFLFLMAVLLLRLADRTGIDEVDRLVVCWDIPVLRGLMSGLELVFLFGIGTVMTAGVGALLQQLFGLPTWVGGALFAAAVAVIALSGLRGLVSAFSVSVPILVAVTIAFGAVSLAKNGFSALPAATYRGTNPMMPVWWVGAMTFACYNIFGNFAVLAPLSRYIPNKKTAVYGHGPGRAAAFVHSALGVMLSLYASPSALKAELPMLSLSSGVSPALGIRLRLPAAAGHVRHHPVHAGGADRFHLPQIREDRAQKARRRGRVRGLLLCREPCGLREPHRHGLPRVRLLQQRFRCADGCALRQGAQKRRNRRQGVIS
jgi:uncharacterized membrane protein YkvI